jgi:plasmid stabilization system protein ParE
MYSILWLHEAEISYYEEVDFIFRKWNIVEVENFIALVYDFLETLSQKPTIGIYSKKFDTYSFVISKQTTLFYKVIENELKIELLLFWNNKQNPKLLEKFLK